MITRESLKCTRSPAGVERSCVCPSVSGQCVRLLDTSDTAPTTSSSSKCTNSQVAGSPPSFNTVIAFVIHLIKPFIVIERSY